MRQSSSFSFGVRCARMYAITKESFKVETIKREIERLSKIDTEDDSVKKRLFILKRRLKEIPALNIDRFRRIFGAVTFEFYEDKNKQRYEGGWKIWTTYDDLRRHSRWDNAGKSGFGMVSRKDAAKKLKLPVCMLKHYQDTVAKNKKWKPCDNCCFEFWKVYGV